MAEISLEIEQGRFAWNLDDEDVHLNIEARLTQLVRRSNGALEADPQSAFGGIVAIGGPVTTAVAAAIAAGTACIPPLGK